MKKNSLASKWGSYFVRKDDASKFLLLIAIGVMAIWFFRLRESSNLLLVALAFAGFAVVFSFLNYVIIGRLRESAEHKFYDAIRSSCDLPSEYSGRDMRKIRVMWRGLRVREVTVIAKTNSLASTSAKEWRSLKSSVSDSFKLVGDEIVAVFDDHAAGVIRFVVGTSDQVAPGGIYEQARFEEKLRAFVYEDLRSHGVPLPRVRELVMHDNESGHVKLDKAEISFMETPDKYTMKKFEGNFRQKYESGKQLWTFDWSDSQVLISSVKKGSQQERMLQSYKSISDLIEAATSTGLHWYSGREYVFSEKMVKYSSEDAIPSSINIDFLQSDLSRPERIEKFEELMTQGLVQLFGKNSYEYFWKVSAFDKTLEIKVTKI